MTKVIRRPKAEVAQSTNSGISGSLTQLYYEIDTVRMQVATFSDEDLFDFCLPQIEQYKHTDLDRLYSHILQKKGLTIEEREALEAFAILANTELFLVV